MQIVQEEEEEEEEEEIHKVPQKVEKKEWCLSSCLVLRREANKNQNQCISLKHLKNRFNVMGLT